MSGRPARIAFWALLGAGLAAIGYLLLATTFMPYDDEGFVLISLRNYLAGLRLYDDVFSQYGPWPYVYHQLVTTLLQATMTHTLGRALTLLHWIVMVLLCGAIVWRLVRSQAAAALVAVLTFSMSWQTTSEPSHPGSHIAVLVAAAALLLVALPAAQRPALLAAGLGGLAGLLLLTKINVGLLLAAGVGGFALRHSEWGRFGRWFAVLGAAGLLALPWVLLGSQLHLKGTLALATQFTIASGGLLWIARVPAAARPAGRIWFAAVAAVALAVLVVAGWVLLRGTTPAALVRAVLLNPVRMPARFMVGTAWFAESWIFAGIGGLLAGAAGWQLRRGRTLSRGLRWAIIALRAAVLVIVVVQIRLWPTFFGIFHIFSDCLPLLPVFLVPLTANGPANSGRWAVAWIALPQVLHAYPVAGSQLTWGSFLCMPLLVAGWWEAGAAAAELAGRSGRIAARAGGAALAAAGVFVLGLLGATSWQGYRHSRPLDLPGAENVHVPGKLRQALRLLTLNATIHADLLFERQGMYSYNLWSGVPTPTAQNATHWFWLLDGSLQQEIAARLAATPRSAFIVSHALDEFMVKEHIPTDGPLQDFVTAHYRPLFEYAGFSFRVPQESTAAPFGRLEVQVADRQEGDVPPVRFRSNVLLDGEPVRVALERIEYPWHTGMDFAPASAAQIIAEPIDRNGRSLGPALRLPAPQPLRGLFRLSVFSPPVPPDLAWQEYMLVLRDAQGRVLSESVY